MMYQQATKTIAIQSNLNKKGNMDHSNIQNKIESQSNKKTHDRQSIKSDGINNILSPNTLISKNSVAKRNNDAQRTKQIEQIIFNDPPFKNNSLNLKKMPNSTFAVIVGGQELHNNRANHTAETIKIQERDEDVQFMADMSNHSSHSNQSISDNGSPSGRKKLQKGKTFSYEPAKTKMSTSN